MAANDIKTILHLMKDQQSAMNEKLDAIGKDLGEVKEDLNGVKTDLSEVKETQKDHTKRLEALSGDMEQVLSEVKSTHDEIGLWHQRDKREIDEIKNHLNLPLMADIPED